jgi:hypothetical protein
MLLATGMRSDPSSNQEKGRVRMRCHEAYRRLYPVVRRWAVIVSFLLYSSSYAQTRSTILFNDVTSETGISFRHADGSSGRYYIVESVSSGLALLDYDSDGDVDIYFLNGGALKGTKYENTPNNALYRNDGNWKFTDVTKESGLGDPGHALGVAVGDYDNDGDQDVYTTNFGPNVLFRNNGDGTFTDVTTEAGVANGCKVGAGVATSICSSRTTSTSLMTTTHH